MDFGTRIKKLREYLNLSQEEFGDSLGIKKSHVSGVERGVGGLTYEKIKLIINTYKVDARYLFGQIDSLEKAMGESDIDLIKILQEQAVEIEKLKHRSPDSEVERLSIILDNNPGLKGVVDTIQHWSDEMLLRFMDYAQGYFAGANTPQKKRNAS
jgi:transcriptional regulator with XRE-family HTH domain